MKEQNVITCRLFDKTFCLYTFYESILFFGRMTFVQMVHFELTHLNVQFKLHLSIYCVVIRK